MNKKTETISVRVPAEVLKILIDEANKDRRKVSNYLYLIIEDYLLNKGYILPCVYNPQD